MRTREYLLLSENQTVGAGTEHVNKQSVRGVQVNANVHAVISLDQVFDPTFVPANSSSMQKASRSRDSLFSGNAVQWWKMKLAVKTLRESGWLPEDTI